MSYIRNVVLLALMAGLAGCVVSTVTGATSKERSVGRSIDDTSAGIAIGARIRRYPDGDLSGVRIAVEDGLVLLSGNVPEPQLRLEAERIAWSAPKVVKVANEIEVTGKRGFFGNAKDRWITTQVRSRILADKSVRSVNINIETRNKVVFLLGLVRTEGEIKRATGHASLVPGVQKVVSYLTVARRYQNVPEVQN
ncbi:MAG: transport-associated protein [Robiginitomaculum sp.]|nr:MAG: transport-associated protein [Robiginitomaculum sp.]